MEFPFGIELDAPRPRSGFGRLPEILLTPESNETLERPTKRRTTIWMYEVSDRQKRRLQAMKIVLKFKAEVHQRREARTASVMNRVASLPSELLLQVVKACVESQVGCWNVEDSTVQSTLACLANMCFAWPGGVNDGIRNILKLEAANALIKVSIVQIRMVFSPHNALMLPLLLVERQRDLRRLALDLHTTPMNGSYNRELNKSIKAMPSLGTDFPNMEVFVLTLYFHCRIKNNNSFISEVLKMRNIKRMDAESGWQHTTVEDTAIDLVRAFAESAPGTRKLIRFGNVADADDSAHPWVGPLVEVGSPTSRELERATAIEFNDRATCEEDPTRNIAKRAFDWAYHAPRAIQDREARAVLLFRERSAVDASTLDSDIAKLMDAADGDKSYLESG